MEHYISNDKWCVYYHRCRTNGKYYVGITKNTEQRWRSNGICYKNCTYLWHAIQKYGWDDFDHIILITDLSKECANLVQIQLIAKFNLRDQSVGYNISRGGDGGPIMTGENNPASKTVYQYSLDGDYIREWQSVKSAQKALGLKGSPINNAASGRSKQSGGFQWSFDKVEQMPKYDGDLPLWIKKGNPRVCKINYDGEIVSKYDDYHCIQDFTDSQCVRVLGCCAGNGLTAYGYFWLFQPDCNPQTISKLIYRKTHKKKPSQTKKLCVYDRFGNLIHIFNSRKQAAIYFNSPVESISTACRTKTHCLNGLYFYNYEDTKGKNIKPNISFKYRCVLRFHNGKFIQRFTSLKEAKIKCGNSVTYGVNSETHYSYGDTWLYEDQYPTLKDQLGLEELDLEKLA